MKIPALYLVLQRPIVSFAFWMDSESLFMDMKMPIPLPSGSKGISISTHNAAGSAYKGEEPDYINAGHLSLRKNAWSMELLRDVWSACQSPWVLNNKNERSRRAIGADLLARRFAAGMLASDVRGKRLLDTRVERKLRHRACRRDERGRLRLRARQEPRAPLLGVSVQRRRLQGAAQLYRGGHGRTRRERHGTPSFVVPPRQAQAVF
eukprot:5991069-Prymnesium_polylepis.1